MLVKDVMSRKVILIKPGQSAYSAVKLMVKYNISGMIVSDQGRAVGMLTMKDVCRKVIAADKDVHKTRVGDVMSKPVLTVHPLSKVEKAAELMDKHHVKRLAVVDSKKVVGIVTVMDVVSKLPDLIDVMFKTWVKPGWK